MSMKHNNEKLWNILINIISVNIFNHQPIAHKVTNNNFNLIKKTNVILH